MRPAGIEPAACGLKDRCSLAPRREPLTTELRARAAHDATTSQVARRAQDGVGERVLSRTHSILGRYCEGSEIDSDGAGTEGLRSVGPL
jgi:hypothetical protein